MWPLLACSIAALALALDRAVALLSLSIPFEPFARRLGSLTREGDLLRCREFCRSRRGPIARTAEAYLASVERPGPERASIVEREGSRALERAEARLRGLATIAQIATLIGLLGTVAGLVSAFHRIELSGGQVDPGDLAEGIWSALLTTVFGLSIAIPSFVLYQLFESRVESMARRMGYVVAYLDEWLGRSTPGLATSAGERAEED